jgi:hypothetical protein
VWVPQSGYQGRSRPYGDGVTFWARGEIVKSEAGILESGSTDQAASKALRGTDRAGVRRSGDAVAACASRPAGSGRSDPRPAQNRGARHQGSNRAGGHRHRDGHPGLCPRTSSAWAGGATEWRRWRDRARSSSRGTTTSPPQDEAPSTCSRAPVRGERIQITTADGAAHTYRVATVASYPKNRLAADRVRSTRAAETRARDLRRPLRLGDQALPGQPRRHRCPRLIWRSGRRPIRRD